MTQPRVLIVGGGSIGERHLRCFIRTGQAKVSMCEPRAERLDFLKRTYDMDQPLSDFDSTDLSQFNAVVICTPPNLHVPMALRAVEAGCHILCEKPLSHNLDGVDDLIARVKAKGLVGGVAFVYRNMPAYAKMREIIKSGTLGEVHVVTYKSGQQFSKFRPDYKNIYFASKAMGGGAINDACSHSLNFLQWCFGNPTEVVAFHDHLSDMEIETEDAALLTLRFGRGPMVQLQHNLFQKDYSVFIEFVGSKATLRLGGRMDQAGANAELQIFHAHEERWEVIPMPESERDDYFVAEAANFLAAIRGDEPIKSTLDEGKDVIRMCMAARDSYVEKRIVAM